MPTLCVPRPALPLLVAALAATGFGTVAGAGIVSVAEGGAGNVWQANFAAADPTAPAAPSPTCCSPAARSRSDSWSTRPSTFIRQPLFHLRCDGGDEQ
jgi:hypothetical protein